MNPATRASETQRGCPISFNGSGTFNINSTGQPVVTATVISSTVFNAFTADIGTGLTNAICKDGQSACTARIPFANGINSTLATDATSISTGSILTAGGVGITKALWVGGLTNIAGALTVAGHAMLEGVTSTGATGTGAFVFATSPTLVTPVLGVASATSLATGSLITAGVLAITTSGGGSLQTTLTRTTGAGFSNYISFYDAATEKFRIGENVNSGGTGKLIIGNTTNIAIVVDSSANVGFFGSTAAAQQTSGANLTNNVTSGGTNDIIADFTSLTVYATDAAAIRNDIYQLARKLKQINDGLRAYGLFT